MHAFIVIVILFLAPANGNPESVKVVTFAASGEQACQVEAEVAANELAQDPAVSFAKAGCVEAENPKDIHA